MSNKVTQNFFDDIINIKKKIDSNNIQIDEQSSKKYSYLPY